MREVEGNPMNSVVNTNTAVESPTFASSTSLIERKRLRVLILAYSISPVRGSEYSVAWNHVRYMSHHCDLTVIYGLAGSHMGDLEEIEDHLRDYGEIPNVRFVPIRPNLAARIANYPNRNGIFVYSFYLAYNFWHRQAASQAKRIIANGHFDLVHYLCPIGYREPGYLWKIDKPYIWGPIGGMPAAHILKGMPRPLIATFKTHLKNLINTVQLRTNRRLRHALVRADKVVAATTENAKIIRGRFGVKAQHIPENAIPSDWIEDSNNLATNDLNAPLRLIWIGSLDYRKSPDLLLAALAKIHKENWSLDILGEGPLSESIRIEIAKLGLESKITLHGNLPRARVLKMFAVSGLHALTSLNEANTTVIWEAMAAGTPTLALDHCGMRDTICEKCGVRIQITDFESTRDRIANAIKNLIKDRAALSDLANGTLHCRMKHTWEERAQLWLEVYHEAIIMREKS